MGRKEIDKALIKKNRTICVTDFHWNELEKAAGKKSVGDAIVKKFKLPPTPPSSDEEPLA